MNYLDIDPKYFIFIKNKFRSPLLGKFNKIKRKLKHAENNDRVDN